MLRDVLLDALAILAPVSCAGCERPDRGLCGSCRAALAPLAVIRTLADGTRVGWSLPYDGIARRAMLAFKEQGRTDVARVLAPALASSIAAVADGRVRLALMPVAAASYRRRGYDPTRLALRAAHLPAPRPVLTTAASRGEQKTLGREARALNLAGTMRARGDLRGSRFVLIDDVMTTGATLGEAARAVRAAGGEVVGAAVIAFTPKLW